MRSGSGPRLDCRSHERRPGGDRSRRRARDRPPGLARGATLSRWWIAVAGLVIGAIVGGVYALGGAGSTYTATALIARGQAFSPGGNTPVLSYLSSPAAIEALATSEPAALKYAAAKAGMSVGELRGHVTTSTVTAGRPDGAAEHEQHPHPDRGRAQPAEARRGCGERARRS